MHDSHTPLFEVSPGRLPGRPPGRSGGRLSSRERRPDPRGPFRGLAAGLALALAPFAGAQAAGEVSSLRLEERPGTPFLYSTDGTDYAWGVGRDRLLDGFTSGDRTFGLAVSADRVELRRGAGRSPGPGHPDARCAIFAERVDGDATRLSPGYPGDGSDGVACDTAAMLASRVFNRGALDLFANPAPDAGGVERADYLFESGILAPVTPEGLAGAGHVVAEKGGDSRLKIAAVLSLDILGQPASYGPLVLVRESGCVDPRLCYGVTDESQDYSFFENGVLSDDAQLAGGQSSESVTMAFVSSERLGLEAGRRYFGFSLFADDVDTDDHDPLDPTTFPVDTGVAEASLDSAADVHGGLSGWFIDEALSNGSGRVFLDENGDALPSADEAGIADIQIQLYRDTDGDGFFDPRRDEPVCNATDTDASGLFVLPGLPDGNYFAVLRENDPELPAGLSLESGVNPLPFAVSGGDVDTLHFAFTDGGGDAGNGDADGGDADGGADAGNGDTDGGDTDGGADAGNGDTDGGDTDGGADGGNGDTNGGDTDGGADAGNGDTDGGDTDGGADGGADAGNGDTDGGDTDGGADAGNGDAGGGEDPDPGASLDDTTTRAEQDRFDVLQDIATTMDVLANDDDGSGEGLTITSVAVPQNGTAEVIPGVNGEQDMILYTPDDGYFGPDAFIYQIQDGNGFETSGTVTANVIRYSDINGNRENDFVECQCTDLTLETGVHGSGIGRSSLALLGLIAGAVLLRRRSRTPGAEDPR